MSKTPATDWYQDRPDLWDDDDPADACEMCGGDGVVGWFDHPELHGDDCAEGLEDHLLDCPRCGGTGAEKEVNDLSEAGGE